MVCAFVNFGETVLPALAMAQQCLLRLCNMLQQATNSLFPIGKGGTRTNSVFANYGVVDFYEWLYSKCAFKIKSIIQKALSIFTNPI
jgi:hypothetical protein